MREMKDSGIEWIGEIPRSWELNKIGAIYEERNTKVSDSEYEPLSVTKQGIVPQLETAAKTDNGDNRKLIRKNDFVINSRSDRRGSCGISDYDGSCSLINTVLKPRGNMNNKYYSFVFKSDNFADEFYRWGHGIVNDLWSTKWSDMKNIYIPSPTIDEQKRIANYLDEKCSKIDTIIEKQQEIIERLKEYKLSVITEAVTKGLNPNVEMKKSGIRKLKRIPYNWNEIKITRMLDNSNSYPMGDGDHGLIKTDDYKEEGIPYIRVQNLGWGTELQLDNVIYISEEDHERIKSSELHPNDILFCKTGATIGKTGMVPESIPIANTTSHVGKITLDKKYNSRFVFYFLSSHIGYVQFWNIACLKSTRPELAIEETKAIRIAIPRKRTEQDEIVKYLDEKCRELDFGISKKEKVIDKLEEYKKSLIYEVVTGKREV